MYLGKQRDMVRCQMAPRPLLVRQILSSAPFIGHRSHTIVPAQDLVEQQARTGESGEPCLRGSCPSVVARLFPWNPLLELILSCFGCTKLLADRGRVDAFMYVPVQRHPTTIQVLHVSTVSMHISPRVANVVAHPQQGIQARARSANYQWI